MPQADAPVAVVTGGNRGIGRAIAVAFADAGYDVAVTARKIETCADVVAEIEERGRSALALPCDITDEASVGTMADAVVEQFGAVHTVVANAGITGPTAPLHEIDLAAWRECLATDVDGVFLTFRVRPGPARSCRPTRAPRSRARMSTSPPAR